MRRHDNERYEPKLNISVTLAGKSLKIINDYKTSRSFWIILTSAI